MKIKFILQRPYRCTKLNKRYSANLSENLLVYNKWKLFLKFYNKDGLYMENGNMSGSTYI